MIVICTWYRTLHSIQGDGDSQVHFGLLFSYPEIHSTKAFKVRVYEEALVRNSQTHLIFDACDDTDTSRECCDLKSICSFQASTRYWTLTLSVNCFLI